MRARSAVLSAEATNPVVISQGSGKLRLRLGCRDGGGSAGMQGRQRQRKMARRQWDARHEWEEVECEVVC